MGRFNTKPTAPKTKLAVPKANTINKGGGQAYKKDAKTELVSLLSTSMLNGKNFYESDSEQLKRLQELLGRVDPEFAAKAAIYTRTKHGLRSITHAMAALLAPHASGKPWATAFYNQIVYRVDDAGEILGALWELTDTKKGVVPAAMKRGFAKAIGRFNEHQLSKYAGGKKAVKLVDLINLVHPKGSTGAGKLIKGTLEMADTWESSISAAGPDAEKKAEEWKRLLLDGKLGIFALLRNVNNIVKSLGDDKKAMKALVEQLTDRTAVKKSLILPFQFAKAIEAVEGDGNANSTVLDALRDALDLSLDNCPDLCGNTVVVLDVSGSMQGDPIKIGSLFSAVLIKALKDRCKFVMFATAATMVNVSTRPGTWEICSEIRRKCGGGGTNFHSIFDTLRNEKIDAARVIILSDMMGWMGFNTPQSSATQWAKEHCSIKPTIYNWNLNAAGTSQFVQSEHLDIMAIDGWSDKVFDQMAACEEDPATVLQHIEDVKLG
jgi:hypothetical protein